MSDDRPHRLLTECACVGAWGTAVLRGVAAPDRALDAMRAMGFEASFTTGGDAPQGATSLAIALGSWRSRGIAGWRYVPVAPGDFQGVPGPQELRVLALDAGAVLVSRDGPTVALVPQVLPDGAAPGRRRALRFTEVAADGRGATAPESLAELDRDLLHALTEVTDQLDELEVAGWRDEVADLMRDWDRAPDLPPATPARAQRLAARSGRVLALVDLASDDHGGSRTALEMSVRADHLRTLARVARAAHAAAWNAAGISSDARG